MSEAPAQVPPTLLERATVLLVAERKLAVAVRQRDAVRDELLADIEAELAAGAVAGDKARALAARRLEVPGGLVSYVEAGSGTKLKERLCVEKLESLGARLRAL